VRIDLHTHSVASSDGSLTEAHYRRMLAAGLDYIAVTDHNTTAFACQLQQQLGDHIIVGEEITTTAGEIIGLYLTSDIPAGLSLGDAIKEIQKQDGVVYIPHPFETVRKGVPMEVLQQIAPQIDIIETHNGRAVFQNRSRAAVAFAAAHNLAGAASSDAHGWHGWGKTYSIVAAAPTRDTLVALLQKAQVVVGSPGVRGLLYPKVNRIRRKKRA
jgi:predicted metal-dependent phosphoesterase TrpH